MTNLTPLPDIILRPIVERGLIEDFGNSGDVTARLLVPESATGALVMRSRDKGVIAGMQAAQLTYALVDPSVTFEVIKPDGSSVSEGDIIARLSGPSRSLLSAERVALNFLGRMSGIASLTAKYVDAVDGTGVRIAATRKTTPGLRALEKQAVLAGGGFTHRESLSAAIMIKDNHIALAGGVDAALSAIRTKADHMIKVSVEVDTLEQLEKVLIWTPDVVLLDNMDTETLKKAVKIVKEFKGAKPTLEASGGVKLSTVKDIAETGINVISIGALTHSAPNFDIGMDAA